MTPDRQKYPERLVILMPTGSKAALDSAAREQHKTMSELARQLLLEVLVPNRLNPWRSCPRSKRTQRKLAEDLARARFDHAAALHAVANEHAAREAAFGGID
jgi:hypothetical protein